MKVRMKKNNKKVLLDNLDALLEEIKKNQKNNVYVSKRVKIRRNALKNIKLDENV